MCDTREGVPLGRAHGLAHVSDATLSRTKCPLSGLRASLPVVCMRACRVEAPGERFWEGDQRRASAEETVWVLSVKGMDSYHGQNKIRPL